MDKTSSTTLVEDRYFEETRLIPTHYVIDGKREKSGLSIYQLPMVYPLLHRVSYGRQPSDSPTGLYHSVDDGDTISAHGCTLHYGCKYRRSADRGL
jgi:hypothetical protein